MKKIGDIMEEMGFNKDASNSVKEAFIKHLIKSATGVDVKTPTEKLIEEREIIKKDLGIQLSFDFSQDKGLTGQPNGKKVS